MFLKRIEAAARTIKDSKAALDCVDYVLEHEAKDFYEQAGHNDITKANWKKKWSKLRHVYVSALKATGSTPDPENFED
jgi:hypothetical protein